MKTSTNPLTLKFYTHLATEASKILSISARKIKVIGNSMDYPDSIAISMDDICRADGFALVRYDAAGKTDGVYVISAMDLMKVYNNFIASGHKVLCQAHGRMSTTDRLDGRGDLTRITWEFLEDYKTDLK